MQKTREPGVRQLLVVAGPSAADAKAINLFERVDYSRIKDSFEIGCIIRSLPIKFDPFI